MEEAQSGDDDCRTVDDIQNQSTLDKLSELASLFSRTVQQLRKQIPASSNRTVRSDSLSRCTPPRSAPDIIPSTQDPPEDEVEYESDSVSSSRSTRKKLIAPWRTIIVKERSEFSQEEAYAEFAEYAQDDLAKAGPQKDVKIGKDDYGGFKAAHVSAHSILFNSE